MIIGALYSLKKISEPDYESLKRRFDVLQVLRSLAKDELTDEDFKTWAAGYYFLNAVHRVVWSEERILKYLFGCPMCGEFKKLTNEPIKNFCEFVDCQYRRILDHFQNKHSHELTIKNLEDGLNEIYTIFPFPLDSDKQKSLITCRLRHLVNKQKHFVQDHGVNYELISSVLGNDSNHLDLVYDAVSIVGKVYNLLLSTLP